jgi:hypothetical protein
VVTGTCVGVVVGVDRSGLDGPDPPGFGVVTVEVVVLGRRTGTVVVEVWRVDDGTGRCVVAGVDDGELTDTCERSWLGAANVAMVPMANNEASPALTRTIRARVRAR